MNDELGDRMKEYEEAGAGKKLMKLLPVLARIDGRAFSSFTEGLDRPYDPVMSQMMVDTTKHLVKETNALMGYCQSDEISLLLYSDKPGTQIYFDGRHSKITSQLAAQASVFFFSLTQERLDPCYSAKTPTFDCRVWNVPNKSEAANCFLWRELDATRNSISMAAHHYFDQPELHGVSCSEMQEMLFSKGINWNDYPAFFKRGTYVRREVVNARFSAEELDKLPPLHNARKNPDLLVERSVVEAMAMPPFNRVINREGVLFNGEKPLVAS